MLVGCGSRPPDDISTSPKRPSWKCSVTVRVCVIFTSMPSYRSGKSADANGSVTSVGSMLFPVVHVSTVAAGRHRHLRLALDVPGCCR